jgi:hypothetical protein
VGDTVRADRDPVVTVCLLLGLASFSAAGVLALAVIRRHARFLDRLPVLLSVGAAAMPVIITAALAQRLAH